MRSERVGVALVVALGVFIAGSGSAQAQQPGSGQVVASDGDRPEWVVQAHGRAVGIPGFILDIWFDQRSGTWTDGQANLGAGVRVSWLREAGNELSLSLDWADLSMPNAFWKEKTEPDNTADFTTINAQLITLTFISHWTWRPKPWLSPYVGGGLGVGLVRGDIIQYNARQGSSCSSNLGKGKDTFAPAECFASDGGPNPAQIDVDHPDVKDDIPPVLPVLHISGGARFFIGERAVLNLEVGVNNYVYAGLALGAQF